MLIPDICFPGQTTSSCKDLSRWHCKTTQWQWARWKEASQEV